MGGLTRHASRGQHHLLWRDTKDQIAGGAWTRQVSADTLSISYCTADLLYEDESQGELELRLVWKGSADDNARPFACCPECPRHVDVLVLKDEVWCCALCHRLKHRSAMIRKEIRWAEELVELDPQVTASVALGISATKAAKLIDRHKDLSGRLAGQIPTASRSYLRVLQTEYVALPEGWSCSPA